MDIETARKILAAVTLKPNCEDVIRRQGCESCDEWWPVVVPARRILADLGFTPTTLAALILAVEALEAGKKARLATGWRSTCDKQVHGDSHIQCGKCFICLERKALAAWEAL